MPQNTTKNILISIALIAFIISSGAFTIYQLARRQTNTNNIPQTNNSIDTGLPSPVPGPTKNITSSLSQLKELNVTFDPYVCGLSITGVVDKPDLIQKLEFTMTNKDKNEIKQSFTPKIDGLKNFKILVDEKIVVDGIYKLEANALLTSQKAEITETTIEFKKDCVNLIQNSTPSNTSISSTAVQIASSSTSSQNEIKTENPSQSSSSLAIKSIQSSVASKQVIQAPTVAIPNSSSISSVMIDSSNNTNAVRTGGLDFTAVITILMLISSTALIAKFKTKEYNFNEFFGKK